MSEYARARHAARARAANHQPPESGKVKERKPMRRVSKERAKLMKTLSPERRELKEATCGCMKCRKDFPPELLDVHEIAAGAAREPCLYWPCLQLVLCRKCHNEMQGTPAAKQIAVRAKWDIENTCLKYCELKGYAPTAVVADEVIDYLVFTGKKPRKKRVKA